MSDLKLHIDSLKNSYCTANYLIFLLALLVTAFSVNYHGVEASPLPIILCTLMLPIMSYLAEKHFSKITLGNIENLSLLDYFYIISNIVFVLWLQVVFNIRELEILIFPFILFAFNYTRKISLSITIIFIVFYGLTIKLFLNNLSYESILISSTLLICLVWIISTFSLEINTLINTINHKNQSMTNLIQDLPLAIWVIDQERNIIMTNKQTEALPENTLSTILERFKHLETESFNNKSCEVSGKHLLVSNNKFFINPETNVNMIVVNDTTLLKKAEESLQIASRLSLVGEMAAGIAHEIRNPMTTVRGFLQLLSKKDDCVNYQEYFNIMIEELDRANDIIKDYLSLARSKPEKLEYKNLGEIVKSLYSLVSASAINSNKNIILEVSNVQNLYLNEKEIRQLVLNITQNGLEAMDAGGILTIKVFEDLNKIILSIQDQGKGIPDEVLKKIGTPFLTTKDNGTGLGLATCYNIAQKHNAKINIETNLKGTKFSIEFDTISQPC